MAEIIDFSRYQQEPDIGSMDKQQLQACLEELRARIAELDAVEPADMESEEYEEWGEAHEDLEDLVDEILDRLEDLD